MNLFELKPIVWHENEDGDVEGRINKTLIAIISFDGIYNGDVYTVQTYDNFDCVNGDSFDTEIETNCHCELKFKDIEEAKKYTTKLLKEYVGQFINRWIK